jgi:hypothetical protein
VTAKVLQVACRLCVERSAHDWRASPIGNNGIADGHRALETTGTTVATRMFRRDTSMITIDMTERRHPRGRRASNLTAAALAACWLAACGDSSTPIVGSKNVITKTTPTMVVEAVIMHLPFKAVVHNGGPRKIVIRGEDNLLSQISVKETKVSRWEIDAPLSLNFEQHSDLQIEIPYIDMVEVSYNTGGITFADQPFKTIRESAVDAGTETD